MAEDVQYLPLSASTNGGPIAITQTGTAGNTVHTSVSRKVDVVEIYATNIDSSAVVVTFEFGGVAAADQLAISVGAKALMGDPILVCTMVNGVSLAAFAGTGDVINLVGVVKRYG